MTSKQYAIVFSFLLATLICVFGCHSAGIGAQADTLLEDSTSSILRVGTSGDYKPFSFWPNRDPEPAGFSPDLIRAFAGDAALEIEWVRFRWPDLLADLSSKRFDLAISGITVRTERSIAGHFSLPLTTSGAVILVPSSASEMTRDDLNQPETRLAVNAGGHLERVARQLFTHASVVAVERNEDVLLALLEGRVDGAVTDTLEAPHWQKRSEPSLRQIGPLTQDRKAALLDPAREALSERFDDWLIQAEKTGHLTLLREKHGLPAERTAAPGPALLASLDERLSLMIAVAEAKRVLGLAIEDIPREKRVLEAAWGSVERAANSSGTRRPDRLAVERLFRAQIEAAKWIQRNALGDEPAKLNHPPHDSAVLQPSQNEERASARRELDEVLRPALIRLGNRISRLVARVSEGSDRPVRYAETAKALARHSLPEAQLRDLHAALVHLVPAPQKVD